MNHIQVLLGGSRRSEESVLYAPSLSAQDYLLYALSLRDPEQIGEFPGGLNLVLSDFGPSQTNHGQIPFPDGGIGGALLNQSRTFLMKRQEYVSSWLFMFCTGKVVLPDTVRLMKVLPD
jgi:hypothetical protein